MKIALHWFRCDLRLADNTALYAAVREADVVIPVFIFDPFILKSSDTGAPITAFMLECLKSLEKDIQAANGKLIFRHGQVTKEMKLLFDETKATDLYFNRDYEPYARERDGAVEKLARSCQVQVHSYKDGVIHEPEEILKGNGDPYRVFTPYSRVWRSKPLPAVVPAVKKFPHPPRFKFPSGLPLPSLHELGFSIDIPLPVGGEEAGQAQLKTFVAKPLLSYARQRDTPAQKGTSSLSPHIRLGTLSGRTILAAVEKAAQNHPRGQEEVKIFVGELIWRDFYRQVLWHFPHVATACFKPQYDDLKWENDKRLFQAWCEGRTGYPIVDAGMRQLNSTGWMHNRVRMIVAMFLTKDLLVSWQWGERYFMQKLMDADLASNNGGWQWSASTGTDAQPYFRIFNPTAQAKKFDPEGGYIRRYVPEADTLAYPAPIVDHARQRVKALALFRKA